jgi:FkbM family methyltransferase
MAGWRKASGCRKLDMESWLRKSVALVPWRWRRAIKRIPLVAPLQRRLIEWMLEGREFIHTVDAGPARGLKCPIILPEDKGVWTGTYELEFSTAMSEAVRPGDVCLAIGGWRGFYAGVMALAGAKRVFIFEPLPANCTQIRKLIDLNPQLPLTLFEAAVGETSGPAEFCVMPMSSMGKLASSPFQRDVAGNRLMAVDVVSLDELLAAGKIEPPNVVKIDVEGAEAFILRGAERLIAKYQPRIFLEAHSSDLARECSGFLAGHGYQIHRIEPDLATPPGISHFVALPKKAEAIHRPLKRVEADGGIDVPILLYHHLVADGPADGSLYEISIDQFNRQLDLLQGENFQAVTLQRLFRIIEEGEPFPPHVVVITFDDAYRSFIELALPALLARKMIASVFVPAGHIGGTNQWDSERGFPERRVMNEDELKQIVDAGIEIGAHGWAHRDLRRCSEPELREEIFDARAQLQRRLGVSADFFAYPYGSGTPRVSLLLAEAGYRGAVTIFSGEPTVTANRFCMRRIYIHKGDGPLRFRLKLSKPYLRYKAFRGLPSESME